MRKAFTLILVLVLCMTMALPVFAASAGGGTGTGAPVGGSGATVSSMMLYDADGNLLVEAGHKCITMVKLADGDDLLKALPAKAANMEHKYLYDITLCDACEKLLEVEGNVVVITFKMDVKKGDDVVVMAHKNGAWADIQKIEVKKGEVVCTFASLCPVVLATNADGAATLFSNPRTGDIIMMWVAIMVAALAAIAGAVVIYRKKFA